MCTRKKCVPKSLKFWSESNLKNLPIRFIKLIFSSYIASYVCIHTKIKTFTNQTRKKYDKLHCYHGASLHYDQ